MRDVHGIADLPDAPVPPATADDRANTFVPRYFAEYERGRDLPVERPVRVDRVVDDHGLLRVEAGDRTWLTRTLVNATGTWTRPFVPYYPGSETFAGQQFHTVDYPGPEALAAQIEGQGFTGVEFRRLAGGIVALHTGTAGHAGTV